MFWGSQAEDSEHRKMAEGHKSAIGKTTQDSNGEKLNSNEERGDSNGERRDSEGRLLPNPVLCCESLSVRATAQVHLYIRYICTSGTFVYCVHTFGNGCVSIILHYLHCWLSSNQALRIHFEYSSRAL